jgi:hypothetical protein
VSLGPGPDDLWSWAIDAGGRRVVLDSAWRDLRHR